MGKMIDGVWSEVTWKTDKKGRFQRADSSFRSWVGGEDGRFAATPDRYHLYISWACPWAHRTVITRGLLGLEQTIGLSVVDLYMGKDGWQFTDAPGAVPDSVNGKRFLHQIYSKALADYTGRVTVPVLWDKELNTIVNNESREIMRMFDTAFSDLCTTPIRLYSEELSAEIERVIDAIYNPINNGVYRAGFAGSQEAYKEAVQHLFEALDHWEEVLSKQRYVTGDRLTEADICMFTTLLRFDPVYVNHFKCNLRQLKEYPNLFNFVKEIYQLPGVAELCNFEHIKGHYFTSHESVNPKGIIPLGPIVDLASPHNRERLPGELITV